MSAREIRLSHLIGRVVRDADGARVGRIEELRAEIVLQDGGNEYRVREYLLGTYGALETLAGVGFSRQLLRLVGAAIGYRQRRVPWSWLDLTDPERPRLTRRLAELE